MGNAYLTPQLNGRVIQATIDGIQAAVQAPLPLVAYWGALSIATAQDVDGTLDYVGILVGYPRPIVSNIFFLATPLILADATLTEVDSIPSGLSDATGDMLIGGELDTAIGSVGNIMPADWYRQLLPIFAQAKYLGLTLYVVDLIAAWANTAGSGTGYTIKRDAYNNINVVFTTSIDPRALYLANMTVAAIETLPLVTYQEP